MPPKKASRYEEVDPIELIGSPERKRAFNRCLRDADIHIYQALKNGFYDAYDFVDDNDDERVLDKITDKLEEIRDLVEARWSPHD